jgi:hypothetical protein
MNKTCCWNAKNNQPTHNGDCLATFGPQYRDATLTVTFTDGQVLVYTGVRVPINVPGDEGIRVDGTTIYFEDSDECLTACGVRHFSYTLDGDL